jgi:sodium/potassium-transporting ATPase subunit alpha
MMDAALKDKKKGGKKTDMNDAVMANEKMRFMDDHKIPLEELEERLETDLNKGLSHHGALAKLEKYGPNSLSEKKGLPWYCVFMQELTGFFSLLLWFGGFLCFIGYGLKPEDESNLYLGIVLSSVVLITGIFSYSQTSKSAALMAQFKNFIPPVALAIREGAITEIEALKLVPGDIVKVKGGDNIPADIRVIDSQEMKVSNASLTGESEELIRRVKDFTDNPLESPNLAFFGTACTAGTGIGIVISTGDKTVIGQIANLAQSAESAQTPLSIEIDRFIKIISAVAITLGVTFFFFGLAYGYDPITNLVFAIGIIVANVPEGLLATVTVSLALTAKRMANKKVLVKNLESVETLGSTSCICSDKTGTLTQNVMTVSHLWFDGNMKDASTNYQIYQETTDQEKGSIGYDIQDPGFKELLRCVELGSIAQFEYTPAEEDIKREIGRVIGKKGTSVSNSDIETHSHTAVAALRKIECEKKYLNRKTVGDASESGLIKFFQPIEDLDVYRGKYPIYDYQ